MPLRFLRTAATSIVQTRRFFRTLSAKPRPKLSRGFARVHWLIAAILFGLATWVHMEMLGSPMLLGILPYSWLNPLALIALTYLSLVGLNRLAARLTTWEAAYRGIRLPLPVVLRGLDYHAPHYLPVGLLMLAVVGAYRILMWHNWQFANLHATTYLYVLSGAVIVSAAYLFHTYWIAMRNLMYANR